MPTNTARVNGSGALRGSTKVRMAETIVAITRLRPSSTTSTRTITSSIAVLPSVPPMRGRAPD